MQYIKAYKKDIVIDLRKRGYSYSEIEKQTHLPKSTIAFWLRDIKLSSEQIKKLENRRREVALKNAKNKISKTQEAIEKIKDSSSREIGKISKRELWLMGIVMYWRERLSTEVKNDFKNGVTFSSSDPAIVKFFIKWLKDIGGIKNDEIILDVFTYKKHGSINKGKDLLDKSLIEYWSEVTGFDSRYIRKVYTQKSKVSKISSKSKNLSNRNSFIRIRVRASSILARQIAGWVKGIQISV